MLTNRIAERRRMMKMTQTALAEASGVAHSAICDIERGLKEPKLLTAYRIANALECSVYQLFPHNSDEFCNTEFVLANR